MAMGDQSQSWGSRVFMLGRVVGQSWADKGILAKSLTWAQPPQCKLMLQTRQDELAYTPTN